MLLSSCVKHQLDPKQQDGTIKFTIDGKTVEGDYSVEAFFNGFNLFYYEFSIRAETDDKKRIFLVVTNPVLGINIEANQNLTFTYKPNRPKLSKDPDYEAIFNDPDNWVKFDVLNDTDGKGTFQFKVEDTGNTTDVQLVTGSFEVMFQ